APARNVDGSQPGYAWQAYTTLLRGSNGLFPTQVTDGGIVGGVTYTYVIAAKSQPAIFKIVRPQGGSMITDSLVIRPAVANGLSTNTSNRNVAVIYVPASRQAGGIQSSVRLLGASEDTAAAVSLSFRLSKQIRRTTPIDVDLVFSDSATVEVFDSDSTTAAVDSTRVTLFDLNTSGASSARQIVSQQRYVVTDPNFVVDPAGLFLVSDSAGTGSFNKRTFVFPGIRTQATLLADGKPFFVTDSLNVSQLTPNKTLQRADYNGLVVFLTASNAGEINNGATNWVVPGIGPISGNAEPNLQWRPNQSDQTFNRMTNHYRIEFTGKEFGPGSPFTLNFADRAAVQAAFDASLNARGTASQTVTTDAAATVINNTLGTSITSADLVALDLPFTVVNATTGKPVQVAVRSGNHRSTIKLGTSTDTITVNVPANKWVPGDELIFIEEVRRLAQTAGGRDTIIVSGGAADSVSVTQVTWEEVLLGCDVPSGDFTCNPVFGRGGTGYTAVGNDYVHNVVYYQPLGNLLNVDIEISPDIAGDQISTVTEADLNLVFAVPNPYIMFSQYEQIQGVKRLLFTGLPPKGTIRIYTASGQFVQQLTWTDADLERNCTATVNTTDCQSTGDLPWNMRTREDLEVGPGFYVFVVSTDVGGSKKEKIGKFVIIH
ncbi:MAG TPA: hypothetical protein VMO26_08000, partial [Vicinamibacterales bacterium]|nr:hypothetical protein [Vicinamibacterales bacterium]